VSSSSVKTPLSSQVGNFVLIDVFNVFSRVLSIVFFLRASCCFPAEKKTRSHATSRCRATMELSPHPTDNQARENVIISDNQALLPFFEKGK
jgi:hypothetical protein